MSSGQDSALPAENAGWSALEMGAGRPLVLLHGIGMAGSAWNPVLGTLSAARRVIAFDLPGFGGTAALPDEVEPTPAAMAAALVGELRRRGVEPPFDVAGNSLGGYIALEVAKAGLARSVVGISPGGLWRSPAPRSIPRALNRTRRACRRAPALTRLALSTAPGRTVGLLTNVAWKGWRIPAAEAVEMVEAFAACEAFERVMIAAAEPFRGGLDIDVPVTIAFGRHDLLLRKRTARFRDELPPHTRWLTLRGCGHVPMWDDPDAVAKLVLTGIGDLPTPDRESS